VQFGSKIVQFEKRVQFTTVQYILQFSSVQFGAAQRNSVC